MRTGDSELAEKRLRFNLLGVDANTGYIWRYTTGIVGETLLTLAIVQDDIAMADLLLRHGADPNRHGGYYGDYPLVAALYRGDLEVLRLLVQNGADPAIIRPLLESDSVGFPKKFGQDCIDFIRPLAANKI